MSKADDKIGSQQGFEQALANLEAIVHELEEGQIPLADALARYEQGVKLLKQCYHLLDGAQRRIELLNRVDSDGRPHCEPFAESATSLDEKSEMRARRRSRTAASDEDEIDGTRQLF